MNTCSGVTATACMLSVLGAALLSSCGGGAPATREAGPEIVAGAPEMTITPPVARSPEAVGAIAEQTLTASGNSSELDIAPFFQDPDNDPLTYSAESSDPGIASASISGSTLRLTPATAGDATVTVIASDGMLETTQTIVVRVREPDPEPPADRRTERSPSTPQPKPPPQPQQRNEPETTLTDISIQMTLSDNGRHADLRITFVPEDARLTVLDYEVDPWGSFSRSRRIGNTRFIRFHCPNRNRYQGIVTITLSMQRTDVETSVQVDCH